MGRGKNRLFKRHVPHSGKNLVEALAAKQLAGHKRRPACRSGTLERMPGKRPIPEKINTLAHGIVGAGTE